MNFRTTYVLFGALVALSVVFLIILGVTSFQKEETTYVLPSMHGKDNPVGEADIDSVTVERSQPGSQKMVFQRDADTGLWRMTEPMALPPQRVDGSRVADLVREVINASRYKMTDVSGALSKWGLDPAKETITLKKGDKQWQMFLGDRAEGGNTGVVYVATSDLKEPMAVLINSVPTVDSTPLEFRARELLPRSTDIQRVQLMDGTHKNVMLDRSSGNQWRIVEPPYGAAAWEGETAAAATPEQPKTLTGVKPLLDVLAGFKVDVKGKDQSDFVTTDANDLERYGLKPTDKLLRVRVSYNLQGVQGKSKNNLEETLVFGKPVEGQPDKVYAMLEGERHVVKVPAANLPLLTRVLETQAGSLRSRDLVSVPAENVDVVAVTVPGNGTDMKLYKTGRAAAASFMGGDNWKMYRGGRPAAADGMAVRSLVDALTRKGEIKDFPDPAKVDEKALGLDAPAATVSLWDTGIKPKEAEKKEGDKKEGDKKEPEKTDDNKEPELKSATPAVRLLFGKRENGVVYVKRVTSEGGKDVAVVVTAPESLFDTVSRPALTYLDKTLPSFTGDVTAVTLTREGETYKVVKEKDQWKFEAPESLKGQLANDQTIPSIVSSMRSLHADKILSEEITEQNDERFGLKTPAYVVTLTVADKDNKTEDWTYTFAKETAEGVNGKMNKSTLVFQVPKFAVGSLSGELRNTTLFTVDRNNVQAMKITGWYDLYGEPKFVELERKSAGQWSVKPSTDKNYIQIPNLDPKKAEDFLNQVLRERIDRFVNKKSGPQPEKMEFTDNAVMVELTVAGEKEPLTLRVGGSVADPPGWFAKSSARGDEYFILATSDRQPIDKTKDAFAEIRKVAPVKFFGK